MQTILEKIECSRFFMSLFISLQLHTSSSSNHIGRSESIIYHPVHTLLNNYPEVRQIFFNQPVFRNVNNGDSESVARVPIRPAITTPNTPVRKPMNHIHGLNV